MTSFLVIFKCLEHITGDRHIVEADDLHRHRRQRLLDLAAAVIHHLAHTAIGSTDDQRITSMQRSGLDQQRGYGTAALIQLGLNDRTCRQMIRIGLQLGHVGHQQQRFQQVIHAIAEFRGDRHEDRIPAPFLRHDAIIGHLALDPIRIDAPAYPSCSQPRRSVRRQPWHGRWLPWSAASRRHRQRRR